MYLTDRPHLKENMSFDKYKEKITVSNHKENTYYDKRDKDDLMNEILKIGAD